MRTRLAYDREATGDRQQNAIQDISRKTTVAVNQLGSAPNILGPFAFTAGQRIVIDHKLARVPAEWHAVDVVGGYGVFQRIGTADDKTITIQSQNVCVAYFRMA
jgi:hypothetical protein